jgi:hypothetical protein
MLAGLPLKLWRIRSKGGGCFVTGTIDCFDSLSGAVMSSVCVVEQNDLMNALHCTALHCTALHCTAQWWSIVV